MARFVVVVEIDRPVKEVFAYASRPENVPEWNAMVQEVTASETPLQLGTTTRLRMRLLGREILASQEVLEYEANRGFVVRSNGPFVVTDRWTFESNGERTRVTFASEGAPGGFFKLAEPVVVAVARRQLAAQLGTLKELLEARAAVDSPVSDRVKA